MSQTTTGCRGFFAPNFYVVWAEREKMDSYEDGSIGVIASMNDETTERPKEEPADGSVSAALIVRSKGMQYSSCMMPERACMQCIPDPVAKENLSFHEFWE